MVEGIKMVSHNLFLLALIVVAGSAYKLLDNDEPAELVWPTEFTFAAETINLKDAYIETFQVWYSGSVNKSLIEYYNGTYKTYYKLDPEEETVVKYAVHPVTTETVQNKFMCFVSPHDDSLPDFLPKVNAFDYVGKDSLNGKEVHVWRKEKTLEDEEVRAESTVYAYRTEYDFDVPVREIYKMFDLSKGLLDSHTITNYIQFGFLVNEEEVTYEDVNSCDQQLFENLDFKVQVAALNPHSPKHVDTAFNSFKKHHKKNYHVSEDKLRKEVFHKTWKRVVEHNSKDSTYKMELNEFSDWTDEELQKLTGTRPSDPQVEGTVPFPHTEEELMALSEELPDSYDLRLEGYLGPVKNQGGCGSCWAFTTAATVEGMTSKFYGGRNVDLSEQSLVDCAWGYNNYGCGGGQLDKAYEYLMKHGIPKESDYGEYLRKDGFCHVKNDSEIFKIKGYARVTPGNPTALKLALVRYGPVAVAIHAGPNMKSYSHGVYYDLDCEGAPANHGVVVVGYGERDGTPYWIIRNSWGENFGVDGYILISQVNNNCLVMSTPFYPIV